MIYGIHTLDLIPFSFSNLLNHQWIQSIRETLSENVSSYQGIGDQCIGQDVQHIETKAFEPQERILLKRISLLISSIVLHIYIGSQASEKSFDME